MSKHTPGPWIRSRCCEDEPLRLKIGTGADGWLGLAYVFGDCEEEAEANARLIAAAPDLLAICEEFVRKVECGEARSTRTYNQMKVALAKAKGETK